MDKLRIISDLHMHDKGRRDDFQQEDELIGFCKGSIAGGYRLIFNGDILELWQGGDIDGIFTAYGRFWEYIKGTNSIFIGGNHDADWLRRSLARELWKRYTISVYKSLIIDTGTKLLNVPESLCPYARYRSDTPEGGLLVLHGHQYDLLGRSALGWLATAIAGVIERFWWKDVDLYWSRNNGVLSNQNGAFYEPLRNLAASLGVNSVVFSHTHKPALVNYESCRVMNSGSWVNGHSDCIQYDDDGWKTGRCIK